MAEGHVDTTTVGAAQPPATNATTKDQGLAPWPIIDRYPVIIGQGISLAYVANVFRACLTGYRREYVDLLGELLEKDPHAFAVIAKRVETVSCAKLEIEPPEDLEDASEEDRALAAEYAAHAAAKIKAIPNLTQHLASLAWAEYYGVAACEIQWKLEALPAKTSPANDVTAKDDAKTAKGTKKKHTSTAIANWSVTGLDFIHSRRLSYPNFSEWKLHIWDLGPIWGSTSAYGPQPSAPTYTSTTQGAYGLRIEDYPNKFITHAPQLRGDYPTREGLGRLIGVWIVLKLIASRGASSYLERFGRPWPEAIYSTKEKGNNGEGRAATDEDIAAAEVALRALGIGNLSSWTHPDSVALELRNPDGGGSSKITFAEWIAICDSQMSKAALSSTLTTEVGITGSRAVADTQKKGEDRRYVYSSNLLAESVKRDLAWVIIRQNFGNVPERLLPRVLLRTGEDPDPQTIVEKTKGAVALGAPVDADAFAEEVGVALIPNDTGKPRRLYMVAAHDFAAPNDVIGLPEAELPEGNEPIPFKPGKSGKSGPESLESKTKPADDAAE